MEPQKKQQLLITILIIMLILIGLILFLGLKKDGKTQGQIIESPLGLGKDSYDSSAPLKSLLKNIDFDFLKTPQFKALK